MIPKIKHLVVGAGFSGAVIAERIASILNERVMIIDRRPHIGGASYSSEDPQTGIDCHRFGSHIFHTSLPDVWKYINRFTAFNSYCHKVFTEYEGRLYSLPVNLKTINDFFDLNLKPGEVNDFIKQEKQQFHFEKISNLEEKAISMIGYKLYNAFIKGYTKKQWGCDPKMLPPDIIERLPLRYDYNANYFNDRYQGIPENGYGALFRNMLSHPNIEIMLGTEFRDIRDLCSDQCNIFYSGSLDELFDYRFGMLGWRSLRFEWKNIDIPDYQGTAVINYASEDIPCTRVHEFKHLHPEKTAINQTLSTTVCFEYPDSYSKGKDAFYPINTAENRNLYRQYAGLLKNSRIIPIGRLGAYQYWNMDIAIKNSLDTFNHFYREKIHG